MREWTEERYKKVLRTVARSQTRKVFPSFDLDKIEYTEEGFKLSLGESFALTVVVEKTERGAYHALFSYHGEEVESEADSDLWSFFTRCREYLSRHVQEQIVIPPSVKELGQNVGVLNADGDLQMEIVSFETRKYGPFIYACFPHQVGDVCLEIFNSVKFYFSTEVEKPPADPGPPPEPPPSGCAEYLQSAYEAEKAKWDAASKAFRRWEPDPEAILARKAAEGDGRAAYELLELSRRNGFNFHHESSPLYRG